IPAVLCPASLGREAIVDRELQVRTIMNAPLRRPRFGVPGQISDERAPLAGICPLLRGAVPHLWQTDDPRLDREHRPHAHSLSHECNKRHIHETKLACRATRAWRTGAVP